LSKFEEQVLLLRVRGRRGKTIAKLLDCSEDQVKAASRRMYDRLGASTLIEAMQMAIARGLLKFEDPKVEELRYWYGYWGA
jgi:DNA-binding NarL/FixJ family response regulator